MAKIFLTALLGFTVAVSGFQRATPDAATISLQAERYLQAQADAGFFSGAVLIARRGEVVFARGYGQVDVANAAPNGVDTRFRIASATKIFTAAIVLKLEEQGLLSVADPVCEYIAPCPSAWSGINLHHLLTHTSGIPEYTIDTRFVLNPEFTRASQSPRTPEQLIDLFRDAPLTFAPGERYNYVNSGYVVLGVVAEKVGGKPYNVLLDELILTPLGMKDTGVDRGRRPPLGHARGYVPDGMRDVEAPYMDMSWVFGAGNLYSTAKDLLKWDRALYGDRILSQATRQRMWTADRGEYGYGWQVMPARNGFSRPLVFHAGGLHGFASDYLRYADEGVTIVILSNLGNAPMLPISRDLSAIVFGEPYETPVVRRPIVVTPEILADYVGSYQVAPSVVLAVGLDNGRLTVQVGGQVRDIAIPYADDRFFSRLTDTQVTFVRDGAGKVTHLTIHQGGRTTTAARV